MKGLAMVLLDDIISTTKELEESFIDWTIRKEDNKKESILDLAKGILDYLAEYKKTKIYINLSKEYKTKIQNLVSKLTYIKIFLEYD